MLCKGCVSITSVTWCSNFPSLSTTYYTKEAAEKNFAAILNCIEEGTMFQIYILVVPSDGTTISYTYDERGNVLTETTGTTVNSYTYDVRNNRTSHTLTVDGSVLSTVTYVYDNRGRMTGVNGPQGQTSYGYNLDNTRSVELTVTPDLGQVGTLYTYAATGILSEIKTVDPSAATTLSQTNYTYYMDGNVHTETDLPANTTATYTYDLAGRLKTEVSSAGSYSYTYDAAGNRASMTENGATTTYTYDKNNRLLTETKPGSVKSYTYDANGNMLTGDGATYTYDARDRQSSYVKGSALASYTYYPTGLRKTKTANLAITTYVWDGSNRVADLVGQKTEYVKNKGLRDDVCKSIILNALREMQLASKEELRSILFAALPAILNDQQKGKKLSNLLQALRKDGLIENDGKRKAAKWFLK